MNVIIDCIGLPIGNTCGFDEDIWRPCWKYVFGFDTVAINVESNENGWYVDDAFEHTWKKWS